MVRLTMLILALVLSPVTKAEIQVIHPERTHGYFIGDILLQRVNMELQTNSAQAEQLDASQLQSDLRVDAFLYRLPIDEVIVDKQKWLEVRYQIINSPQQTDTLELPALTLLTESGDKVQTPVWEFTLAPLTSSESIPIASRSAIDLIDKPDSDNVKMGIAALLTTLMLWCLWWLLRHFSDTRTLPFANAHRIIKKLPEARRDSDTTAWVALHHAFNNVAGKTITSSTQAELFYAAPWLKQYTNEIEHFFTASSARFYQQNETQSLAVASLCKTLQRAEKRQAKKAKKALANLDR